MIPRLALGLATLVGGALWVSAPAPSPAIGLTPPSRIETVASAPAPSTTSSTVDLAWMNTTTTTVPVPAPVTAAPVATERKSVSGGNESFFECVRWRESRGDYTAVSASGTFMGAYQIYQGGWDSVAASIGRHDLVGVAPNVATPAEQDLIAQAMFDEYGSKPWGGACG